MLFDEGEEIFFSRRAMTLQQQQMVLKFAQIRQKNYFIVIGAPSLFLLEKWLRGVGKESRVDCIWRIVRRGMFYSYGAKTGSLQKIRIDGRTNDIKYPTSDFVGFWQPIPKKCEYWNKYLKRKDQFLKATKESAKLIRKRQRQMKKIADSLTIRDIAEIQNVKPQTVRLWINRDKAFSKRYVFIDMTGRIRIKMRGYEIGLRRLEKKKQQQVKLLMAKKTARKLKLSRRKKRRPKRKARPKRKPKKKATKKPKPKGRRRKR